ncbi:MAG: hypothetical protein H6Q07_753 [Acidobacteria bacterium]|nr:hypothetical protein [Acidobacteriota bacterium]
MVRLAGLEPATHGLGNRCSIHLSYRRTFYNSLILLILRSCPYFTIWSIIVKYGCKYGWYGIQTLRGVKKIALGNDIVSLENRSRFMARHLHRYAFRNASPD